MEPPLKETPNKGQDSEHKTPLSYIVLTHIYNLRRKEPLYNEQNNLSQKLRYSEVPLYINTAQARENGSIIIDSVEGQCIYIHAYTQRAGQQ